MADALSVPALAFVRAMNALSRSHIAMSMPRLPAELMVDTTDITIYGGEAENYPGNERIDWVVTNPYGPIPPFFAGTRMLIHQWRERKLAAESYIHNPLNFTISGWNHDKEAWWAVNVPDAITLDLRHYAPEEIGWHPYEMVHELLEAYVRPGETVWDGFMGRGTIAKACRDLGIRYVGVEVLAKHVQLARRYLGI